MPPPPTMISRDPRSASSRDATNGTFQAQDAGPRDVDVHGKPTPSRPSRWSTTILNILTSVAMTLEQEGYQVRTYTTDGESALQGLTARPVDLAVLDVKMPRMDGMELLQRLRVRSAVPVIFLTSKDEWTN